MPSIGGLTTRRMSLAVRATILHMSLASAGLTLAGFGLWELESVLQPSRVLFHTSDDELANAVKILEEKVKSVQIQVVGRDEAIQLLLKDLSAMRDLLREMPRTVDPM